MPYLKAALALITHHPILAYGAIFLVSLAESLALVGLVVPGTVIMFGVGAVVATGSLGLKPVLLLAMAGAVAGDGVSYWLGHHYRERLARVWPFSRYPGMLEKGVAFFHRHGGKSILFGRFVGPVRPVIPLVAGMLGMRPLHFSLVNVLSAVGWAPVYILPGVFFGTSLAVAGAVSTRLAVLAAVIIAATWAFVWFCRKVALLAARVVPIWLAAIRGWLAAATPERGAFVPVKRFVAYFFTHQKGEELLFSFLVLTLLTTGLGFLGVLQDVLGKDPLVEADQAVYHFFQSLRTPWGDHILVAVTEFGDSFVNICLSAAIFILLLVKRCRRTAGFWALTVLGGAAAVQLMKWAIHLPRPVALYHGAAAYGFPSGHAAMSMILYGFLAIAMARGASGTRHWGGGVAALLISFSIAISRLYLGAHWLSDVLSGFLLGTGWTALLGIAYLKGPAEVIPRRLLVLVAVLVLAAGGGWHLARRHHLDLAFYAPRHDVQSMPLERWLTGGWRELPAWRIDLAGEQEQPLTIQWTGPCEQLAQALSTGGWHRPPSPDLKAFLGMFSPDTPIDKLPVLPRLHDGRVDRLRLIYRHKGQRWVLRLWPAAVTIAGSDSALFVGTLEAQHRRHLTGLITTALDTGEYDRSLEMLKQALPDRFRTKTAIRAPDEIQVTRERRRLHWGGEVLLVWH